MTSLKKTIGLLSFASLSSIMQAQDRPWSINIHDYRYDMTVYATVWDNGTTVSDYSNLEVAAFVGNECRGIASLDYNITDGHKYCWLNIRVRSNAASGETVSFRVYDTTEQKVFAAKEQIVFTDQGLVGMPSNTYGLTKPATGDEEDAGEDRLSEIDGLETANGKFYQNGKIVIKSNGTTYTVSGQIEK